MTILATILFILFMGIIGFFSGVAFKLIILGEDELSSKHIIFSFLFGCISGVFILGI